jgi:arsenate reductase-like glutaredoxin family protein
MLVIYAHRNCRNIVKVCDFLDDHGVNYHIVDLVTSRLTKELINAWSTTHDEGLFGLIQEFKIPKQHKDMLFDGAFSVFLGFLVSHPFIFKSPILYDGRKLSVGGNVNSVRIFLTPSEKTRI